LRSIWPSAAIFPLQDFPPSHDNRKPLNFSLPGDRHLEKRHSIILRFNSHNQTYEPNVSHTRDLTNPFANGCFKTSNKLELQWGFIQLEFRPPTILKEQTIEQSGTQFSTVVWKLSRLKNSVKSRSPSIHRSNSENCLISSDSHPSLNEKSRYQMCSLESERCHRRQLRPYIHTHIFIVSAWYEQKCRVAFGEIDAKDTQMTIKYH
jgi:hypothetical protein